MNVQLNPVSETRKALVISLEAGEVDAARAEVVSEYAQQARIPGFRPGKAPAALVAKRFAKEIEEEFKQNVVSKAYRDGLKQQKLDVLTIVNVEPGEVQAGKPAAITFTVDIRPEFKLPDYVGLSTEIPPTEPTEAEVNAVVEGMRAERAAFNPVTRPSAKSDYVKLAYEGKVDGKPILEIAPEKQIYGKVPQTWEEVEGEHEGVIPGLGKELAGLKPGDKKDVTVTFPAEFPAVPELAGKTATYSVEVQEIRERVLPPLDEAFFKSNRAESLEQLKGAIAEQLKVRKEARNHAEQRRQISDALAAKVDFPLPDSLIENETQHVLRNFIEENMRQGVPQEQFEKDKKQLFEGAKKAAAQRVKVQLILAKIAEAEKLEVTEQDIDSFIYRESIRSQQKPDKLVKALTSDREQLRAVQQSIIFDKAIDFLVSKATVSTVQPKA